MLGCYCAAYSLSLIAYPPTPSILSGALRCSMFDVGCWMFQLGCQILPHRYRIATETVANLIQSGHEIGLFLLAVLRE